MIAKLPFSFVVEDDNKTMTITQAFDAPRQLVWDCHTKSELLNQWFAPKPYSTKTKFMNFTEGGHWHYAMIAPDGLEHYGRMDFRKINRIENYVASSGFCDSAGTPVDALPLATWNVRFMNELERTIVRNSISYDSPEALQQIIEMGMKEGITASVKQLVELLVTLK
jgi:uncharacterized protein YndB with AHSA1/START domain